MEKDKYICMCIYGSGFFCVFLILVVCVFHKAHRRMKLKKQLLGEIETLVIHVVHNGFGRPKHRNFQKCLRGSSLSQFTFFSCAGQLPGLQKKSCISTSLAGLADEFPNCMATLDELIF